MKPRTNTPTPTTKPTHPGNIPIEISNYLVLPLLLPPSPSPLLFSSPKPSSKPSTEISSSSSSSSSSATAQSLKNVYHYLYLQHHAPRLPHPDTSRSLYAANLPVDATEGGLRTLFAEQLGGMRVERVEFEGEDCWRGNGSGSSGDSGGGDSGLNGGNGVNNHERNGKELVLWFFDGCRACVSTCAHVK